MKPYIVLISFLTPLGGCTIVAPYQGYDSLTSLFQKFLLLSRGDGMEARKENAIVRFRV